MAFSRRREGASVGHAITWWKRLLECMDFMPNEERVVAYLRWRALHDCKRNSISMLAQAHFSPQQLHGVDAASMVRMLREEKGVDWDDCPPFFKWGTYIKKEEFEKPAFNPKTQQEVRRFPNQSAGPRALIVLSFRLNFWTCD